MGDEPYLGKIKRTSIKPGSAAAANHPLMRLFQDDESAQSWRDQSGPSAGHSASDYNWSSGTDTIRPHSIALPDLDGDSGISAFAPSATPWFMASATAVGGIPLESALVDADGNPLEDQGGRASFDNDIGNDTVGSIQIPSDLASPTTVRAGFGNGGGFGAASGGFSGGMGWASGVANPFSKAARARQPSNDSMYGMSSSSGPFGGLSSASNLGNLPSSPPSSRDGRAGALQYDDLDTLRSQSPESFAPRERNNVTQSPSLPTLSGSNGRRRTDSGGAGDENSQGTAGMGGRTLVSPRNGQSSGFAGAASRLRSNTAPNYQQAESQVHPPLPAGASGAEKKNVLNFGSSPFEAGRAGAGAVSSANQQRKPTALNIQEANASAKLGGGPMTPRPRGQDSEDDLLTPMPNMSPSGGIAKAAAAATSTSTGFPFPVAGTGTNTSSPASSLSTASSGGTLYSAAHAAHGSAISTSFSSTHSSSLSASSTAATSLAPNGMSTLDDWPTGPPIRAFDYNSLVKTGADVHAELERLMLELGDWLSGIDAGMTRILGEC